VRARFLWRFPYLKRVQGVLDGVRGRPEVGPPRDPTLRFSSPGSRWGGGRQPDFALVGGEGGPGEVGGPGTGHHEEAIGPVLRYLLHTEKHRDSLLGVTGARVGRAGCVFSPWGRVYIEVLNVKVHVF
jgi:hypothetical protein